MAHDRSADGLCAVFKTRADADLAVEHLVQEHGLDRSVVFLEPVGEAGSTGLSISGGDTAGTAPSPGERNDAPLAGAIRLTVAVGNEDRSAIVDALREAGARQIEGV